MARIIIKKDDMVLLDLPIRTFILHLSLSGLLSIGLPFTIETTAEGVTEIETIEEETIEEEFIG